MGFGLICAGYSTLIFLRLVPVEIIGFFFILKGLKKLSPFNRYFQYAKMSVYPILLFSLADVVFRILNFYKIATGDFVVDIFTYMHRLVLLPFYITLFYALRTISDSLGFTKGVKRATLGLSSVLVYYLVFVIAKLDIASISQYMKAAETVLYLVLFFVTELAVGCCFRAITTDEAEQKEEEKLQKFEQTFGKNRGKGTKKKK
ncbi:MAG: hypothetical protein IKU43_04345 [Clostridia bacterium]|nr:hypothetical protein [Clostridia bacterium]